MALWPQALDQVSPGELGITWNDGHRSVYPVRTLRLSCRCANCVEEMSGKPMLDPASVAADVAPTVINPVGRYAIHIAWSDGHTSGIYTYEHLRGLCPCCKKP
jgi:ATP-binding protein involved in chromosome partitioning